ncbi:MAG: zeta toxin family protein [Lachnospiraceae bacterium]|nr:zeta toxin family protein [Lachnospiraceae bacterium]
MGFNQEKVYTIYAGVNGAGKSTIYRIMNPVSDEKWVNSDEILRAAGGDWNVEKDQWDAMKEAAFRINHFIKEGISFSQESTLAGRTNIITIRKAKEQGFFIRLYYVGLANAALAVERVRQRVEAGGHG